MILLAAVILLSALTSQAQDTPAAEVSAGYFYLRLGLPDGVSHRGAAVFRVYRKTVRASFAVVFRFGNH
jgi:hypothetical protein